MSISHHTLTNFFSMISLTSAKKEFEIVLQRIQVLGLGIYGIETWLNREFYDVQVAAKNLIIQTGILLVYRLKAPIEIFSHLLCS